MYTFLFAAGLRELPLEQMLGSAGQILKDMMPSQQYRLKATRTLIPEIQGGWVCVVPESEPLVPIITEVIEPQHAGIVFGTMSASSGKTAAEAVCQTWRKEGIEAVRRMDGCFSAVLVDRMKAEVFVVCDIIGRRYVRYFSAGNALLVSPHDLSIIATGLCPVAFNWEAAYAIVSWGWSFQNESLLQAVHTLLPDSFLHWSQNKLESVARPILDFGSRIKAGDAKQCEALNEQLVEEIRSDAKAFVSGRQEIIMDLTAGLDTRAVLGLLLSVVDASRIHARTRGEPDSMEVSVARKIAKQNNCRFSIEASEPATAEGFLDHADVRAFHMNGDTSSKRALSALPGPNPGFVRVSGGAAEIFRGVYYLGEFSHGRSFTSRQALAYLDKRRAKRFKQLPWRDSAFADQLLTQKLARVIEAYEKVSLDGYDSLDFFYLCERLGVWGSLGIRFPWQRNGWGVFTRPTLVQLAFRLPAPIGYYCHLHDLLVRRYASASYWVHIEGMRLMPLRGGGVFRAFLRQVDYKAMEMVSRLSQSSLVKKKNSRMIDEVYADVFAGPLASLVRDTAAVSGGFGERVFGREGMERLLEEHNARRKDHADCLGSLITLERWSAMILEAHRRAQSGVVN